MKSATLIALTIGFSSVLAHAGSVSRTLQADEVLRSRYGRDGNQVGETSSLGAQEVRLTASSRSISGGAEYSSISLKVAGASVKLASFSTANGAVFDPLCAALSDNAFPYAHSEVDSGGIVSGIGAVIAGTTVADLQWLGNDHVGVDITEYQGTNYVHIVKLECKSAERPSIEF